MKLSIALLLLSLQVSAINNYAQGVINLKADKISIQEIFTQIEKQAGYHFYYSSDDIPLQEKFSINVVNAGINQTLSQLFNGINLKWKIVRNNKVIISVSDEPYTTSKNYKQIKGAVQNEFGEPISGASVNIKGTARGVISDVQGVFLIEAVEGDTLKISAIGYTAEEIVIGSESSLTIILKIAATQNEEVVVVGYGTQKRANLTGAISTIDTKKIVNRPSSSLTNTLQGMVPGMAVIARPGDVGNDIGSINIRGRGNFGTSSPLYIVDGVPVSASDFARIRPNDVASISVFKDAAAAIYGSRAAYGVVLVTTKTGQGEKMVIDFDVSYGSQKALLIPRYVGSYDYAILRNEAAVNAGQSHPFTDEQLRLIQNGSDPDLYPDNNWYKKTLRHSAPLYQAELSVSGGGKTKYFLSGGYMKQGSLLPGKRLDRYSLRANTETRVSRIFKVGTNISLVRDEIQSDGGSLNWQELNRKLPLTVIRQSDGAWGSITSGAINTTHAAGNPIRQLEEGGWSKDMTNRFYGTLKGVLQPIPGLEFNGSLTYNFANGENQLFKNRMDPVINFFTKEPIVSSAQQNSLDENWLNTSLLMSQLYGSYEKRVGDHFAKLMVGASYEDNRSNSLRGYRTDFPSNSVGVIGGGSVNPDLTNGGNKLRRVFLSDFARLNYSYQDKYLLEASFRADASSQFAPGHRWGYFPSVGLSWVASEEGFLKNADWINTLKIRASWGRTGDISNIGYYDYLDAMTTGIAATIGGVFVTGIWPGQPPNPTLTWEKVDTKNLGLDFSFFKNKIYGQIDIFGKLTYDALLQLPNPVELGYTSSPFVNVGKISNKGIETQLNYSDKIGRLSYTVTGNFSTIRNKILDMGGLDNKPDGKFIYKVGGSVGDFYMYRSLGLFANAEDITNSPDQSAIGAPGPGDIKYADVSGPKGVPDEVVNALDRTTVGNDVPYTTYGVGINLSYRNFDVSAFGQGVSNVKVYLEMEASQAFFNSGGVKEYVKGRWTIQNPDPHAVYPRVLVSANNTQNLAVSDFWLFNADYFRVKTITIGYSFPEHLIEKLHIKGLRIYLSSNNLFTIRGDKRMKDFDPESPSSRGDFYPGIKTISGGLNLKF
ncbi:MAG: TonB-dependent receptor [Chitinophagaceae bacterium]|nr:TonB-dependent receptor [Chitinophagaceae bacterium]